MIEYKYGEFTTPQIQEFKKLMRNKIFFLLLIVDPDTCNNYNNIDVNKAFDGTLTEFGGFNSLVNNSPNMVRVMSLLEAARIEWNNPDFSVDDFRHCLYRKLILDAGNEVDKIKEVD